MKKSIIFSLLGAFCFMLTSCGMMNKKEDSKKHSKKPSETHRRYHSRSSCDYN